MEATFQDFLAWFESRDGAPTIELREWLDEWLDLCKGRRLRPATVESYRTLLALHVDDRLGRTPLSEITASQLNRLYDRLLRVGRRNGKGGLSARTVRYLHTVLNKALADAVRAGHLTRNPAALADPPSPRAAKPPVFPVWTPEELTQYLIAVKDDPHYLAFHLAASTGLRRGELLGLRWCDIDCERRQLQVVQALIEVGHDVTIGTPKTERSRRVVALDARTTELFAVEREIEECRQGFDDHDLVFKTQAGDPIHPALFSYYFVRSVRRAGVRRIRLHDLRHTHATHALQAGVHPKVVSERLGHSTVTITLDIAPGQTVAENASQGDVVLYDWNNDGVYDHEAIIVASDGTNPDGTTNWDLVDAHTNNRYHAYWTLAQYNTNWATTRIAVLHIPTTTS